MPPAAKQDELPRVGRLIRINGQITDPLRRRVRDAVEQTVREARQSGHWPVLIFELHPGASEYGQAYELADYISGPALNGATTVAYIPENIEGHLALVALSCDEIAMAPQSTISAAGDDSLTPAKRVAYREIAERRKTVPADVALAMLDPAAELHQVETDVGREIVLSDRLDELKRLRSFQRTKIIKRSGEPGVFAAEQGRELGFVTYVAPDRQALAAHWKLPREAIADDPSLGDSWRPARVYVHGPITEQAVDHVIQLIEAEITGGNANLIIISIDSAGGSPTDTMRLCSYLARLDPSTRRTVAYVPKKARGDAAWIALSCDQLLIAPGAVLGGYGDGQIDEDVARLASRSLEDIAKQKQLPAALAIALVDLSAEVAKYSHKADGREAFFIVDRLPRGEEADWLRGETVSAKGSLLEVDGARAADLGLATETVERFDDVKALYGLEEDPKLLEPTWAMALIDALNSDGARWFLLFIGAVALYIELHTPGLGAGGIIGALCFLLYFWSAYLGGTAGWLEVILFITGVICLLFEVFVFPGVTVFGLSGGLLVVASIVLASQTFVLPHNDYQAHELLHSLTVLVGAGVATIVAAVALNRFLPRTPVFNRMLLEPPQGEELSTLSRRESVAQYDHLVGSEGTTATPLYPSGKALIDDELVDVMTDGEFIERGVKVVVVAVRGNRVLVQPASETV